MLATQLRRGCARLGGQFGVATLAAAATHQPHQQLLQQTLLPVARSLLLLSSKPHAAARCSCSSHQAGTRSKSTSTATTAAAAATTGPLDQQQPVPSQQQQQLQQQQPEQQQQQQPLAAVDSSVQETLKLLEASIGPLSTQPMITPSQARVFVISGPSGVGKDAVLKHLQQRRPDLHFVVTATSRSMRPGEVEGKDYFFVSKQQFEEWIAGGQLLEHALVYGEYKGIPRGQVDAALGRGADVVLRIDVQGAATVRQLLPGVVSVFLVAESEAQLVARLVSRKTEQMDKMMTRVQTARHECRQVSDFDYVVVNREGQLEECVDKLCAIIDAERLKTTTPTQTTQ